MTLITAVTVVLLACLLSLSGASEQESRALVSLLPSRDAESSLQALHVLMKSALNHAPGYFGETVLLLVENATYPSTVVESARVAGWRIQWVHPSPHMSLSVSAAARERFSILHVWTMDFDEVVYMDPLVVFVGKLRGSFTSVAAYPTNCKVWTSQHLGSERRDGAHHATVFAIQPSATEYMRLHHRLDSADVGHFDSLLHSVYTVDSGELCRLPLEKCLDTTTYTDQREVWNNIQQKQVVRFNTAPWHCPEDMRVPCDMWQHENASTAAAVTVVSAYYPGPNKHGSESYVTWGRNFLAQPVSMIIFTDNKTNLPGLELRDPRKTMVVEADIAQFFVSQSFIDWEHQLNIDPERSIHSTHLFKMWVGKTGFVLRAININPFRSSHYAWVDYGMFRTAVDWPASWTVHAERFPTDIRLLLMNFPDHHTTKKIAGGIMAGNVRAWRMWSSKYHPIVSYEVRKGTRFIGDDQILMTVIAEQFPGLVCRITANNVSANPWWFMQYYLAGKTPSMPCEHVSHHQRVLTQDPNQETRISYSSMDSWRKKLSWIL